MCGVQKVVKKKKLKYNKIGVQMEVWKHVLH